MQHLFYVNNKENLESMNIDSKYSCQFWQPSLLSISPKGLRKLSAPVWWLFHQLRVFTNRNYGVFLIYDNEKLIHRSFIFPRYFRFPFMAKNDLQIGDTYTNPEYRGKNLATFAIHEILRTYTNKKDDIRKIWYLVAKENTASIRVIEKAGFKLLGTGQKKKRLGVSFWGYYDIDQYEK
jgi:RimJ/RimL family protein N-acetyltransferase